MNVLHFTDTVDNRRNSGTALWVKGLVEGLSHIEGIKQYLFHFDLSTDPMYALPGTTEIRVPLINFPLPGRKFFSFIVFWVRERSKWRGRIDICHWHTFRIYPLFWLIPSKKFVVSMHDAGIYILPGVNNLATRIFRLNIRLTQKRIDRFTTASQVARISLGKHGPFPLDKITSVPSASNLRPLDHSSNSCRTRDWANFILCVSRWQEHKNVQTLVRAYKIAYTRNPSIPDLVLVGKPYGDKNSVSSAIIQSKLERKVKVLEDATVSELDYLYQNCVFTVNPSLHEGFGLSTLESMNYGKVCLVHNDTATREVLGIKECEVDMKDETQLSKAILDFLSDTNLRSSMEVRASMNSQLYSWARTSNEIYAIYRSVLNA